MGQVVLGTAVSNAVLTGLEARWLRRELGGLELARSAWAVAAMLLGSAVLAGLVYFGWWALVRIALGCGLCVSACAGGSACDRGA